MAQFDVYRHPVSEWREEMPYVVDVQSSWVERSELRLTVPLVRRKPGSAGTSRLYPLIDFDGEILVFDTLYLTSYDAQQLRQSQGRLDQEVDAIYAALDYAFHGY